MQTQSDGFRFVYNTSGQPSRLASAAGGRWTLRNDAGGDLTRMARPDGAVATLIYNGSHQLVGYGDLLGQRTSYGYDANGFANLIRTPSGGRTSYAYLDWGTTRVQDAAGAVTTLLYNFAQRRRHDRPAGQPHHVPVGRQPAARRRRPQGPPQHAHLRRVARPHDGVADDPGRGGGPLHLRLRRQRPRQRPGGPTGRPVDAGLGRQRQPHGLDGRPGSYCQMLWMTSCLRRRWFVPPHRQTVPRR